jgi:hypothetical protein
MVWTAVCKRTRRPIILKAYMKVRGALGGQLPGQQQSEVPCARPLALADDRQGWKVGRAAAARLVAEPAGCPACRPR